MVTAVTGTVTRTAPASDRALLPVGLAGGLGTSLARERLGQRNPVVLHQQGSLPVRVGQARGWGSVQPASTRPPSSESTFSLSDSLKPPQTP